MGKNKNKSHKSQETYPKVFSSLNMTLRHQSGFSKILRKAKSLCPLIRGEEFFYRRNPSMNSTPFKATENCWYVWTGKSHTSTRIFNKSKSNKWKKSQNPFILTFSSWIVVKSLAATAMNNFASCVGNVSLTLPLPTFLLALPVSSKRLIHLVTVLRERPNCRAISVVEIHDHGAQLWLPFSCKFNCLPGTIGWNMLSSL